MSCKTPSLHPLSAVLSFETANLLRQRIKQLDSKVGLSRQLEEKGRLVELLGQKIKLLEMQEVSLILG